MISNTVLDASVALSWLLPGEETQRTLPLRDRATENPQLELVVPPIFWYEVGNSLWAAARRKRIDRLNAVKAMESLMEFQLTVWIAEPMRCLSLAFDKNIAVYDAAYLSLAMEGNYSLWTVDKKLKEIAESSGVTSEP